MRSGFLLLSAAASLFVAAPVGAAPISDNFEGYSLGAFPSPTWSDVGAVHNFGQILPSATVVSTTDAFGNTTQAVAIRDQVTSSRGIYAPTNIGRFYSLAADLRVDQYATGAQFTTSDWAMQLTFAHNGIASYNGTPQAGIYASSLTQGWRLFLIGELGLSADIDLGVAANVGIWYRLTFDADALTGNFHTRITDVLSGTQLLDNTQAIAGWTPGEANWDSIAFFGAELTGATSNQAVVDNVNISSSVPEPDTLFLFGAAGLALGWSRRKRPWNELRAP